MKLEGKTIVYLVAQEYEDIELLFPLLRLSEEGARNIVVPISIGFHPRPFLENKPVTGRFGHPIPIPVMPPGRRYTLASLDAISAQKADGLFIPGGFAPDYLRRDENILNLVRDCHAKGKMIATICHGAWVLISAGVVKGRRATGVISVRDDLTNAGAEFVDAAVVRDGNIITSRTPNDLPELCLEIISALSNSKS